MTPPPPDTLARLRAANPARAGQDDGRGPVAQAALARILEDPGTQGALPRGRRRRRLPRGLALVLAALVVGVGGAVAATDPFGWRSGNPDTARYGVNPALHVRTPRAQVITCRRARGGAFRCTAGFAAQTYQQIDAIPRPAGSLWSRETFAAAITKRLAAGKVSQAGAARFRTDLAALPDSFFTEMQVASRFATYSVPTAVASRRPESPSSWCARSRAARRSSAKTSTGILPPPWARGSMRPSRARVGGAHPRAARTPGSPRGSASRPPNTDFSAT